jgi:Xaa-Pro dipeptidase
MADDVADRRAALESRQALVGELLKSVECEQLLLCDPGNTHWFCEAPITRGIIDPAQYPVLILSPIHRFVVCSNIDSQRLFDNYLDDLGFQLKEWPWHQDRDQLLADLTDNKKLASDRLIENAVCVADRFKQVRPQLDARAQLRLRNLGADLAHALEASARNISKGSPEREAAGHLGHRLLHRGIEPVVLHIAADDRLTRDPRPGFTTATINHSCTLLALGQRDGLHCAASRSFAFGDFDRHAFDVAMQVMAAREPMMKTGTPIRDVFQAGQKAAVAAGQEHIWRDDIMGHGIGWLPVEQQLHPESEKTLSHNHAYFWQVRINASLIADTFFQNETAVESITGPEDWPTRRYQIGEQHVSVPDVLMRA